MREIPRPGDPPEARRAARRGRRLATFKLAAPLVEIVHGRVVAGSVKAAANINRFDVVGPERS